MKACGLLILKVLLLSYLVSSSLSQFYAHWNLFLFMRLNELLANCVVKAAVISPDIMHLTF